MSVLREIAQKVKELLDELEKLPQEETVTFEYPFEDKEEYFCLNINGEIIRNLWSGGPFDEGVYTQGHVFKNREEARKERDRRALLMRFNQFRDKCNGDWKPESEKAKYYIFLQYANLRLCVSSSMFFDAFNMFGYFKNCDDAKRAIELFGDEIKRLWVDE